MAKLLPQKFNCSQFCIEMYNHFINSMKYPLLLYIYYIFVKHNRNVSKALLYFNTYLSLNLKNMFFRNYTAIY
jgi:hypothetical protein